MDGASERAARKGPGAQVAGQARRLGLASQVSPGFHSAAIWLGVQGARVGQDAPRLLPRQHRNRAIGADVRSRS